MRRKPSWWGVYFRAGVCTSTRQLELGAGRWLRASCDPYLDLYLSLEALGLARSPPAGPGWWSAKSAKCVGLVGCESPSLSASTRHPSEDTIETTKATWAAGSHGAPNKHLHKTEDLHSLQCAMQTLFRVTHSCTGCRNGPEALSCRRHWTPPPNKKGVRTQRNGSSPALLLLLLLLLFAFFLRGRANKFVAER